MSEIFNDDCYSLLTADDSDVDQDLLFHLAFKSVLKKNYLCPFDDSIRRCLDIGCSGGSWAMEMSTEFPQCQFIGIDIESRAPENVFPINCLFEESNFLKERLPYPDNSFDVVHIRMTLFLLDVEQIRFLLGEASRVTRQHGYVEILEPDLSADYNAPLLSKLVADIKGVGPEHHYEKMLIEHGLKPTIHETSIPLGKWGGMTGEFALSILKMVLHNNAHLSNEENINHISNECEMYKPQIKMFSGFCQKV
ncbi:11087_t:CDS:2 [Funneliformis geosporum]|uniref:6500_t:CDS:1 n=1 Tax=Funneliformis geosporum TaxID=1117311 RepID=A0A9W4SQS9_9GLOM|nr:11087_t:CDS:2 [Funneliformis geosporum]CAI2177891.1 6500_t:CDS:2 [Funneliformis geosporum]